MATIRGMMDQKELSDTELQLTKQFMLDRDQGQRDLVYRVSGRPAARGSTGYQFAGYNTLIQFYRGDQWDHDEPEGATQSTDNYCGVVVDNLASLVFDEAPEINCPVDDETDDLLELMAEGRERLIHRVWDDNDYEIEFDEWSKVGSMTGDAFLKGPWYDSYKKRIIFSHIEDPSTIIPIWEDQRRKELKGFIHFNELSQYEADEKWGDKARERGIVLKSDINRNPLLSGTMTARGSDVPTVKIIEYWTEDTCAYFANGEQLLDWYRHNWGFVPLEHVKNIHSPGNPYGKSDIEDLLDPQLSHNRTNSDLGNFLKWLSGVNLWGKNLEGMEALVAGLSRIYSLPDDGEIHAFEKTGDPYISNTYVQQRRSSIIELSGVSETLLGNAQGDSSGRALAIAFQGTIRKLKPKAKRYKRAIQSLNSNILKLIEIYHPETKPLIRGDYRNEVYLPNTLLRQTVDTINKLQSGIISQTTAMRESGVEQPKREKKLIAHDLQDPILGPQIARQPALLPRLQQGQNQPGDQPNPAPGNAPSASQAGAVAANNQQAGQAAPVPNR